MSGEDRIKLPGLRALFERLDKKKRTDALAALGLCGMLLLALPEVLPQKQPAAANTDTEGMLSAYENRLEARLCAILSSMEGVGKCRVMLTLESGETAVYATTQRTTRSDTNGQQTSTQTSFENEYVLVDGADGRQALVEQTGLPQVRGVVILCEGGQDISCVKRVTEAAQVVLGISSSRVCVNKLD